MEVKPRRSAKQRVQVENERVKQEIAKAEQQIVQVEADAKAIEIRGEALRENPIVLKGRYINALKNGNTVYVPTESGGITLTRETGPAGQTNSTPTTTPAGG